MNALHSLCTDGLFESKYQLIEAFDRLLLNMAINYYCQSPPYENWANDYSSINYIKEVIKGDLKEYLSNTLPNPQKIIKVLTEDRYFLDKEGFLGYLQEMKDKIILLYDWTKASIETGDLVWRDYQLLDELLKAFKEDLRWNENAFVTDNGQTAKEMLDSGVDAINVLWMKYKQGREPNHFKEFAELVKIVNGQIDRFQGNDQSKPGNE